VDKFRQLVQGNASQNKNKTELQGHEGKNLITFEWQFDQRQKHFDFSNQNMYV
jgi:hypothetical protein